MAGRRRRPWDRRDTADPNGSTARLAWQCIDNESDDSAAHRERAPTAAHRPAAIAP